MSKQVADTTYIRCMNRIWTLFFQLFLETDDCKCVLCRPSPSPMSSGLVVKDRYRGVIPSRGLDGPITVHQRPTVTCPRRRKSNIIDPFTIKMIR